MLQELNATKEEEALQCNKHWIEQGLPSNKAWVLDF